MKNEELRKFHRALKKCHELDSDITVSQMLVLLNTAFANTTIAQLASDLNCSQPAITRTVDIWAEYGRGPKMGREMINRVQDPNDRRSRILSLTEKGRTFLRSL